MPDRVVVFEHLLHEFAGFGRHIPADRFRQIVCFENGIAFFRAEVATQQVGAIAGSEVFFEITNQTLRQSVSFVIGVIGRVSSE